MDHAELSPPQRLALAYAPRRAQPAWRALFALDARCAGFVRARREPMLAQIRLAWWRERLQEGPANWPRGEPLLAELAAWGAALPVLAGLVDGWEALLAEGPLPPAAMTDFADGRAAAVDALARHLDSSAAAAGAAARLWALADLAAHLADPEERAAATAQARAAAAPATRLPRALRPLAVLATLARAELAGRSPARRALAAIRVGIAGI
ncbi:MAG: hypothetical protein KGM17_12660 [Sphingomonadales bacterium]|nr:hypothetical protein [Sphingomonadales bacterium]